MFEVIRDTKADTGGKLPVEVKQGESAIFVDFCTPGVHTAEGVQVILVGAQGAPVPAVLDSRDVSRDKR